MSGVQPRGSGDDWVGLFSDPLSVETASTWATVDRCGAVVVFSGTVRDHAEGRPGVTQLEYEAYQEAVEPRLADLAAEARRRWPDLGRVVLWHRVGPLAVGDTAVIVAVSTGHRAEAFAAAEWCIDTLKASVPIWKRERWAGGEQWGTGSQQIVEVGP
ncbi:MAG: molybdenum cofactor biosynthesis protein MoaE [Acidimicrobiales bacterium]